MLFVSCSTIQFIGRFGNEVFQIFEENEELRCNIPAKIKEFGINYNVTEAVFGNEELAPLERVMNTDDDRLILRSDIGICHGMEAVPYYFTFIYTRD